MKLINFFRACSVVEGISYLLILSVTAGFVSRDYVFFLGMAHGLLFMMYFLLSLLVSHKQSWSIVKWLLVFVASVVPFAFIVVEWLLQQEIKQQKESAGST